MSGREWYIIECELIELKQQILRLVSRNDVYIYDVNVSNLGGPNGTLGGRSPSSIEESLIQKIWVEGVGRPTPLL